VLHKFVTYLLT